MKKFISAILITLMVLTTGVVGAKVEQYSILGQYETGDIVENDGDTYICVEHMKTNQCSFGEDYEPGVGSLWEDTWELIDENSIDENDNEDEDDITEAVFNAKLTPGTPDIYGISTTDVTGTHFTLSWKLASSENPGQIVKIYENNVLIKTITAKSGEVFTSGDFSVTLGSASKYNYYINLCNKSDKERCTKSNIQTLNGKGTISTPTTSSNNTNTGSNDTSTLDRDDFPTFKELPRNRTFTDYEKSLETSLKNDIKNSKLTRIDVRSKIAIIDKWLTLGYSLNRKGQLSGEEKRSILILQMTKKILEKYD